MIDLSFVPWPVMLIGGVLIGTVVCTVLYRRELEYYLNLRNYSKDELLELDGLVHEELRAVEEEERFVDCSTCPQGDAANNDAHPEAKG